MDNNTSTPVNLKNSLLAILAGGLLSYATARLTNAQTPWTPYRNQIINAAAAAVINTAVSQLPKQ